MDQKSRKYDQLFKGEPRFDTESAGFNPLPNVLRSLLFLFGRSEWRILTWIIMRSSADRLCRLDKRELAYDLGFTSPSHINSQVKTLEEYGFIKTAQARGLTYVLWRDPIIVARELVHAGQIKDHERIAAINDVLEAMKQPLIELPGSED